jgi:small subunit ribosomal protein S20
MPNSASAKKRHRQSLVRRSRNRAARSSVKTQVKKVREAISAGDVKQAETEFREASICLDRVAAAGVIHKNTAARVKSRLSTALKSAKTK